MKIISLFSGAGGLDLGFKEAGHDIIWANDIDKDSCNTYKKNIGNHIICGDLTKIKLKDIPECDVIIGGFPCQGFSLANLLRTPNDDRNKLYKQFYRVVKGKNPLYFVAENVRGILSLDGGKIIKKIVKDFSRIGYRVNYKVINMADYGVPQRRLRVIIIGTRVDIHEDFEFPQPNYDKNNWISIAKALKGIPEPEDKNHNLKNHIYSKYKITNRDFTGHRLTNPEKPSPTILARGNGKGGVCAIQHPKNHRRMSVRESAIIQTFPLDFEFEGSMGSMYRQVGNAVPVLFSKQLASKFKEYESLDIWK